MLSMTRITVCANLPGRLPTTASNDKKLFKNPSLTTFEAGSGLDGHFKRVQAVVAVSPFVNDTIYVR